MSENKSWEGYVKLVSSLFGNYTPFALFAALLIVISASDSFGVELPITQIMKQVMLVSGLSILGVLSIYSFRKQKPNKEAIDSPRKPLEPNSTKSGAARLEYHQEELHKVILNIFKSAKDKEHIFQSYIGAFPIAGNRDLISFLPDNINCEVERVFGLMSPYEINFAVASSKLKDIISSETAGKVKLKNAFFKIPKEDANLIALSNVTICSSGVIVTFKYEPNESNHRHLITLPNLFADVSTTRAIIVDGNRGINKSLLEYFSRQAIRQPLPLEEIKKTFYYERPVEYKAAIAYSVIKEIAFSDELNIYSESNFKQKKLGYAGIVGSLAEAIILQKETHSINDIDVLLFVSSDSLTSLKSFYEAAERVASRFSIEGVLKLRVNSEMAPLHRQRDDELTIQVIINDFCPVSGKSFLNALESSVFTMTTRLFRNIPLFGDLENYYRLEDLNANTLWSRHDPYSFSELSACLHKKEAAIRYWDSASNSMKQKFQTLEGSEFAQFEKYVVKWALVNFYFINSHLPERQTLSFEDMTCKSLELLDISNTIPLSELNAHKIIETIKNYPN